MDYDYLNHHKFLLIYHIVLVTKYRHRVLDKLDICEIIKDVESRSDFVILEQEFEPDHLHMLIKSNPRISISVLVNRIKSMSTNITWTKHKELLKKFYWKKNVLWSEGYFACTIGNASITTIRQYIQSQG